MEDLCEGNKCRLRRQCPTDLDGQLLGQNFQSCYYHLT